jgi:glycosyltransferase involved in cell wall biosynthesis
MKLLHVASGRLFGGIERMLVTLAASDGIAGVRHQFAVCCESRLALELRAEGALVHSLGDVRLRRPATIVAARRSLDVLLADQSPDVVICHAPWTHALFGPVIRGTSRPLVRWLHDRFDGRSIVDRWARRTPADLVIANSTWTARCARPLEPASPIEVVPCPVSVTPPNLDRAAIRDAFDTPADHLVVLIASRLQSWKGHLTLIGALAEVKCVRPDWTLWIAGGAQRPQERSYATRLQSRARQLGISNRVRFIGERSDIPGVMRAADLLCQPNDAPEPFGVVLVEALACGLPVVTVRDGGAADVLDDRCARFVEPRDTHGLARVLDQLMTQSEDRAAMARAGVDRATAFAPEIVLPALRQALQPLTARAAA